MLIVLLYAAIVIGYCALLKANATGRVAWRVDWVSNIPWEQSPA